MLQTAQKRFDADYAVVRKLVLKKKYSLDIAKMWLEKHGKIAAGRLLVEKLNQSHRIMDRGIAEELAELDEWEKDIGEKDE